MVHNGVAGRASWASFAAWAVVGAGLSLGMLSVFTIGTFVLTITIACAALLVLRTGVGAAMNGLLEGLALPLLYVGFANRSGPGEVCTSASLSSTSCVQEWSPWPWLAAGTIALIAGAALFATHRDHPR